MVPYQSVTDPVGPGQRNRPVDVALVQDLVARAKSVTPPPAGTGPVVPKQPDVVDGDATDALFADVGAFQKDTMKVANPDLIVSPGGPTYKRLLAMAGAEYRGPAQFLQSPTGRWKALDQARFASLFAAQFTRQLNYNWTQPQPAGLRTVLQGIVADETVPDLRWAAYMMATVQREAPDVIPIEEGGQGAGKEHGKPAH